MLLYVAYIYSNILKEKIFKKVPSMTLQCIFFLQIQHELVQQELEQKQQELDALTTRIQNLEDVSILE